MECYDLIIIGAGPAGLAAAIYMARARYRVLVMEKEKIGGQITITSEVVNYPGIEKTSGTGLTEAMRRQAEAFGAAFAMEQVTELLLDGEVKIVKSRDKEWQALSVIIAAGASPRKLGFKGEKEYQGRGVAYCATCDGEFFTGLDVFVIGGGFAAAEEAMFLTRYAREVRMIIREPDFTCARSIADEAKNHPGIKICYNTQIQEAGGDAKLQYAVFHNDETGETWRYDAEEGSTFGIFVFAGYEPASELVKGIIDLDPNGYVITDGDKNTSVPGVCAAGDICVKNLRQVVTAVSDGAAAATTLEKHVASMYEKLGLERRTDEPGQKAGRADTSVQEPADHAAAGKEDTFIDSVMREQLETVFSRFENRVLIRAVLDDRPISGEVKGFLNEIDSLSDMLSYTIVSGKDEDISMDTPYMELCREDGTSLGTGFHGVPGGHEFNSFITALYNAAGPGQQISVEVLRRIKELDTKASIKVVVSLSCTMCPGLVTAVQRIAIENPLVTAEIYDITHFPELRERYDIMSVPCMIMNDRDVYFGKKDVEEILECI